MANRQTACSPFDESPIYWYFRGAQKKAQIQTHYRFHDLSPTFASHFVMNGGSLYDLQKLLGHARFEETQRYAHLTPEHLAKAVNIVSENGSFQKIAKNKRTPVGHNRDFFEISDTEIFQFLCPKIFPEGLFLGLEMSLKRGSQIIGHPKNRTSQKAR